MSKPFRVGIGGPVGTGKTALMDALCKALRDDYDIAAITNDIYTEEDAQFLTRSGALPPERIRGVETGGCPHTAIREDASINLAAIADMHEKFPELDIVLVESGGDNLAATFSPELADITIYVIDVSAGDKIPRKGGPGITRSDLLIINKIDLAPLVGADLGGDGPGFAEDAGRTALPLHESEGGCWTRRGRRIHSADGGLHRDRNRHGWRRGGERGGIGRPGSRAHQQESVMKLFGFVSILGGLLAAGAAQAHETGVPHDGGVFHPVFGVDHLMILLGVAVVAAIVLWRSR